MTESLKQPPQAVPTSLTIEGLRGFASSASIPLAKPTGGPGSGITFLVGPNNCGKSTVLEALQVMALSEPPSFSVGQRNRSALSRIHITLSSHQDSPRRTLTTVSGGGSETEFAGGEASDLPIVTVPSRRNFRPFFNRTGTNRASYMHHRTLPAHRGWDESETFPGRLQRAARDRKKFDAVLGEVLSPVPNWNIDRADNGMYYLRFSDNEMSDHSSDGMGDGLISVFYVVDALYDSQANQIIAIDEPELSLHPHLQRRLMRLLMKYAHDRQVILATHSPYFVNLEALANGASLSRLIKREGKIAAHTLKHKATSFIRNQLKDLNNPHVLGLNARETFFLDDRVILVEGQEDVVFYEIIARELNIQVAGTFFGWGVGGASKMQGVARILSDLGFEKVVGLLDNDKERAQEDLSVTFPDYQFFRISAPDVRTKRARPSRSEVQGVLDRELQVRDEYKAEMSTLLKEKVNPALT